MKKDTEKNLFEIYDYFKKNEFIFTKLFRQFIKKSI